MDAALLELPPPIIDSDHELELVALVRSLRQEVAELRREVVDLRQQAHYWQTMHARAVEKGEKLQREIDQLRGENRQLKDRIYGIKSEKHGGYEHSFCIDDLAASEQTPKRRRGHQPQSPGPQRRDYSHLPVVEQPITLPPEQCVCPQCGKPFLAMTDSEDSEVIEIDVRPYRRRIRRRRYRSTCGCPSVTANACGSVTAKVDSEGQLRHLAVGAFNCWRSSRLTMRWVMSLTSSVDTIWRCPSGTVNGGLSTNHGVAGADVRGFFSIAMPGRCIAKPTKPAGWYLSSRTAKPGIGGGCGPISARIPWHFASRQVAATRCPKDIIPRMPRAFWLSIATRRIRRWCKSSSETCGWCFVGAHVRRDFLAVGKGWPELTHVGHPLGCNVSENCIASIASDFNTMRLLRNSNVLMRLCEEAATTMHSEAASELADAKLRSPCRENPWKA